MEFLKQAENIRAVKGSDRVLRCEATDEAYPIGVIAAALAEKFGIQKRAVVLKLNHAVRNGKQAFGMSWSLASGTPYAAPQERKASVTSIKKKSGAKKAS